MGKVLSLMSNNLCYSEDFMTYWKKIPSKSVFYQILRTDICCEVKNYSLVFQSIGFKFSCELLPGFYGQCMEKWKT